MNDASSKADRSQGGEVAHVPGMRYLVPTAEALVARRSTRDLESEQRRLRRVVAALASEFDATEADWIGELSVADQHPADIATETYEREKDLALLNEFRAQLALIDAELARRHR